jgi:hypothetical protein
MISSLVIFNLESRMVQFWARRPSTTDSARCFDLLTESRKSSVDPSCCEAENNNHTPAAMSGVKWKEREQGNKHAVISILEFVQPTAVFSQAQCNVT